MTDPALTECEECGGPVKKILYPVGIAFKGSGFYVNDYKPGAGKSKTPAAASTDSTETKSETPATTTESTPAPAATTESKPAAAPKTETKTPAS